MPNLMFVIYIWIKVLYLFGVVWLHTYLLLMLSIPLCLWYHLVDLKGSGTQPKLLLILTFFVKQG